MPPPVSGGPNERSALLKSIQKGTKLKKTVTVDKSAPIIPGKVSSVSNSSTSSGGYGGDKPQMSGPPMLNGLGGLFADGIPKLKPVKAPGNNVFGSHERTKSGPTSTSNSNPPPSNNNNFVNTQKQIKMQIKASDNKNRGPPPPAPTRNTSNSIKDYPAPKKLPMSLKNGGPNPHVPFNTSVPNLAGMQVEPNRSSLHKKTMSNTNLGSLDNTDSGIGNNNNLPAKPTNFGKPQLAPKPPPLNGPTSTSNSNPPPSNNNNFVNTQKQIKMQIKASDNKNRGPPPPAPTRNTSNSIKDYPAPKKLPMSLKNGGPNPHVPFNTSVPNLAGMQVEPNRSSLHKKTMSNTNLGSLDNTDSGIGNNNNLPAKPTNFGKPQLAPKPPPLNGKPSIRISLNRTQSMHSPRSPSPQTGLHRQPGEHTPAGGATSHDSGTAESKPGFIDSLENIHQPAAPRATIAERPKAPPPSIPNTPPPPPSKTVIKHPGHAPPPPPPIAAPNDTAPTQAPPPLPHRTPPQIPRSVVQAPISNGSSAPVPPPRFSSMKDVGDFEARFADKFHDVSDFPSPMPFRGIDKVYLGIQVSSPN
ncbi:WH2 motif [Popillia japonica]|uniref:WH2 motif n=1 Tax=Popillia japonica TaxID=7064 RepID=A0AAW1L9H0_POPJA